MVSKPKKKTSTLKIRRGHILVRNIIQVIFFVLFPSLFVSAFNGVKYIFTQLGKGEAIELNAFLIVTLALCLFTFVFGRFFCGYACAFGTLNDLVRWIYTAVCKKLKKKPITLNEKITKYLKYLKYLVLFFIVLMCFIGTYDSLRGTNPWDVFSHIRAGNFELSGYVIGTVLLVLLILGMLFCERFFCRFFCPMGAVFSILPNLPFATVSRERKACAKGCTACKRVCPADINLPERGRFEVSGECFQCGRCVDMCPKKNAGLGEKFRGTELWFTILRAVILLGLSAFVTYGIEVLTAL